MPKIFQSRRVKLAALSLILLLTMTVGTTLGLIITQTQSLTNIFAPFFGPTADLTIRKVLEHPFGDGYIVPNNIEFDFSVALGEEFAGKTVITSQREDGITADEEGVLRLSVKPGQAVTLYDLAADSEVLVTEHIRQEQQGFYIEENEQTLTIQNGVNEAVFTNIYSPRSVFPINLSVGGKKILEGRDWQEGDKFEFLLEYGAAGVDGVEWLELGETSVEYEEIEVADPNDGEETILVPKPDFDKFDFSDLIANVSFDKAGTYAFRISEKAGEVGGVTYDKVVSYFDVVVGDADMDGALEIQKVEAKDNAVSRYDEEAKWFYVDVTISNQYAPVGEAEAIINIKKSMTGGKLPEGYTFELYDEQGELLLTTEPTSAAGEVSIELRYDAKDAGNLFYYLLKETNAGKTIDGVTYDDGEYLFRVSVVDELDGTIGAYIYEFDWTKLDVEEEEEETPAIEDVEEPEEIPEESGEEPSEESAEETEEISEEPAEESEEMMEESEAEEASLSALLIKREAGDDEEKRHAGVPHNATNVVSVGFENSYEPVPTTISLDGSKVLEGRELKEEEFSFRLYKTGANFSLDDAKCVQIVKNTLVKTSDSDELSGYFCFSNDEKFDGLTFKEAGNYYFVIQEDNSDHAKGITYDRSKYFITVTVTDENGQLKASILVTDEKYNVVDEIVFVNKYRATSVHYFLKGEKVLNGGTLKDGMFTFELYEADELYTIIGDKPLETTTNNSRGKFVLEQRLDEEGTYYFVVKESNADPIKGMTYDATVYGIKVEVTDDGSGELQYDESFCKVGGGSCYDVIFTNTYSGAEDPDVPDVPVDPDDPDKPTDPSDPNDPNKDMPLTGDYRNVKIYAALMLSSMLMLIVLLAWPKIEEKYKK